MRTASRVSLTLLIVGGLIWAASSQVGTKSPHPAGQQGKSAQSVLGRQSADGPQLAARYHLRNRTKRFFKRSTHHYRTRAVKPAVRGRKPVKASHAAPTRAESRQLAARYHLRNRTKRFFGRATG